VEGRGVCGSGCMTEPRILCSGCVYWVKIEREVGECRLKPPVLNTEANPQPLWEFPTTKGTSWCGEGRNLLEGQSFREPVRKVKKS